MHQDYTSQGRRPTTAQIIANWKKGGRPTSFTVAYGETFAEFDKHMGRWYDSGNGCRGVQRDKVIAALTSETEDNSQPTWASHLGGGSRGY